MLIKARDAEKILVPEAAIWDYKFPTEDIGVSYQTLNGRGPKQGRYLNTVCHEIYFIVNGSATFYVKDQVYTVGERDIVVVEPGTPHYIETSNLTFITITRPNWYEAQYKEVA